MEKKEMVKERDSWGHKLEFFLSVLGCAVGPGNIFRFPYICMRNGGGAFLLPYFLALFFIGIPMFTLEIYMGQSTRKSCIACWEKFSPIMKGGGYSMIAMSFLYAVLYQSALAWTLYYMVAGFTWDLPWSTCGNSWNTPNCVTTTGNLSYLVDNDTSNDNIVSNLTIYSNISSVSAPMSAAEEYWQYNVLKLSETFEDINLPNWKLCLAHFSGLVMIFFCLCNGVKSVGKVVWVTATLPYALIIVFLVRAILLPGSKEGILFYLTPNFGSLANPETWILAFLQIFYTLAVGSGSMTMLSSYNKKNHNFLIEAICLPLANCLTSFVSGFVIFSCAGFLAHRSGVPVHEAMQTGPGLVFVSYPELTSHLPGGPIWSFLFFLMLLMLEVDSIFVGVETCVSGLVDEFNLSKRQKRVVLILVMVIDLLAGLILFTNAGMYIYQLIDWYYSALAVFIIATSELICVLWIYGFENVSNDWYAMIKTRPPKYLVIPLMGVILPLVLLTLMFWSLSKLSKPVYGNYEFPDWSEKLGWGIAVMCMLPIIVYPLVKLPGILKSGNIKKGFCQLLKPNIVRTDCEEDVSNLDEKL